MLPATVPSQLEVEVRGGRVKHAKRFGGGDWIDVGPQPLIVGRHAACGLVLDDERVSAVHAELLATEQGVRVRDLGSRNGTFVAGVRVGEVFLSRATKLRFGGTEVAFEPRRPERVAVSPLSAFGPMVAVSPTMRSIFERLTKIAPTDLTLLITGETGTGKEVVANAVHRASPRAKKPFVVVDCGSIPPTLAEAALFGHERGAFTGAVDKRLSPFQEADGGTIFLDELGELPLDVQPKLLRALAERRVKPVGASSYHDVDVRVLAATRRDLGQAVNSGAFRSDLYFRIAQVKIELPPLRQRREDIPDLVRRLLKDLGDEGAHELVSSSTIERLMRYDWPGNVRELRNAVAVAHALAGEGEELDIGAHLGAPTEIAAAEPSLVEGTAGGGFRGRPFPDAKREVLARFERDYFAALHEDARGNVSEMARRAGIERAPVRAYLRRYGIGREGPSDGLEGAKSTKAADEP